MSFTIHAGSSDMDVTYVVNSFSVYNVVVDIIRMTKVNSSEGPSETPVTIVNQLSCAIKWLKGSEKKQFDKQTHFLDGILRCRKPVGVTILNSDKVLFDSKYYEIVDVKNVDNLDVLLEIGLKRIK